MPDQKLENKQTMNHDIAGICRRLHRFTYEFYKCVSSAGAFTNEFDQARWGAYLDAADVYISHCVAQPQLDLPESHPRMIDVELLPDEQIMSVENESIVDAMYRLKLAVVELMDSQSSRMGAGLLSFDERRARALIEKCRRLLNDYVSVVQPLDLPESSPAHEMSGHGQRGI
jgi:hypothetical protein